MTRVPKCVDICLLLGLFQETSIGTSPNINDMSQQHKLHSRVPATGDEYCLCLATFTDRPLSHIGC